VSRLRTRGMLLVILTAMLGVSTTQVAASSVERLSATTLNGKSFSLAAQGGHVVLINFWATWCAPCRAEMPALDAYYRKHHAQGLDILAVSVDDGARTASLIAVTSLFAFPVAKIADTKIARSAIPTALPTTRIYGRDGRLRFESDQRHPQALDAATLDRLLGPLLAEPAP
jgi:cytochrome c biogenesis protein CcmG, thiol:disulfide interchange protein DsbE